jgi:hypothetical protein
MPFARQVRQWAPECETETKKSFWEGEKHRKSRATTADREPNRYDIETIKGCMTTAFVLQRRKIIRLEPSVYCTMRESVGALQSLCEAADIKA